MFLYYTAGMYCFYHVREIAIKKAHIAEKLKEKNADELQELIIPLQQVKWVDSHEFFYKGKLYDIVTSSIVNDTMNCVAYHDTEEQKLKEDYNAHISGEKENSEHKQSHFKVYPQFTKGQTIVFLNYKIDVSSAELNTIFILAPYILLNSPPPEV